MLKDFEDFRNNRIAPEKLNEIIESAKIEARKVSDKESYLVTFSANFSLLLLAEYHDWLAES